MRQLGPDALSTRSEHDLFVPAMARLQRKMMAIGGVLLAGVALLFAPTLATLFSLYRTLAALWIAKAVLNAWRCAAFA